MFDTIFAFFHLLLLVGLFLYAFYSLFIGNVLRFIIIIAVLTIYYFAILHPAVKKEIARKKELK
jgi:hypothetical protein